MNMKTSLFLSDRDLQQEISNRSAKLISEIQYREYCKIDRGFFWLMLAQWILGIALAILVTPYTWIGATEYIHTHVWFAVGFGGLVSSFPMMAIHFRPGTKQSRYSIGIAQAVWTGLLIHLTGGRIESHFHAFASLAFLAVYRDWRVLLLATGVIGVDHFVRGLVWPVSVYGVSVNSGFRFLVHVAWIVFMDIFLFFSCFRQRKEDFEKHHRRVVLEEQAKLNEQMIRVSREAGKAEIATGVLHNVGNVINSVNVSADILEDKLKTRLQARLQATHALLGEHEGNLPEFFANDERATHFVPFVGQLSSEVENLLHEIVHLQEKLSHVNSVVASQQALASMSGLVSSFDLVEAVKSAVIMTQEACRRSSISVECKFQPVSLITSDKQRLIQIMVNLLRNAKHAIEDSDSSERIINVGVSSQNEQSVLISVEDTGVGIRQEDQAKIYQHGFSTRKDRGGHGFGLHHTVCLLQEIGGQVRAESPGPGKGATFTVELPFVKPHSRTRKPHSVSNQLQTTGQG